jgi:hypothetical protein
MVAVSGSSVVAKGGKEGVVEEDDGLCWRAVEFRRVMWG